MLVEKREQAESHTRERVQATSKQTFDDDNKTHLPRVYRVGEGWDEMK